MIHTVIHTLVYKPLQLPGYIMQTNWKCKCLHQNQKICFLSWKVANVVSKQTFMACIGPPANFDCIFDNFDLSSNVPIIDFV